MIKIKINTSKPDFKAAGAIFCSDIHLRDNAPECRTDNFEETQWAKLDFIAALQRNHGCPVIHAGDLFHHWKPSPYLISKTLEHLPQDFWTIYGNHDLPQHNLELKHKSGVYAIQKAERLLICLGVNWGEVPDEHSTITIGGRSVLVWHVMTYQGSSPFPGCTDTPARGLLRKFPNVDVILTGHNHKPFVEEYNGRILVNPGGMTRQESDEAYQKPRVYLYYPEDNTVEAVYLPAPEGVVHVPESRIAVEERKSRIDAFISKLNDDWDVGINFEKNLEKALKKNKVSKSVKEKVYKSIDVSWK